MESFQCSKGSAREALKALELEGLVSTRSGPRGGDESAVRSWMHEQMCDAEHPMTALEGQASPHCLLEFDQQPLKTPQSNVEGGLLPIAIGIYITSEGRHIPLWRAVAGSSA